MSKKEKDDLPKKGDNIKVASHLKDDKPFLDYWKINPDQEYTLVKEYFYNGETHYRLKDENGKLVDLPAVFFWEIKETA